MKKKALISVDEEYWPIFVRGCKIDGTNASKVVDDFVKETVDGWAEEVLAQAAKLRERQSVGKDL